MEINLVNESAAKENINNLRDLVDMCAQRNSHGVAFRWIENKEVKEVTYAQFQSDINALGTYFYYCGFKGDTIAVIGENSYKWILTYFAVNAGGNIIVPIDKDLKADAIINVLRDSGAKALIYTNSYARIIEDIRKGSGVKPINVNELDVLIEKGRELLAKGKTKYLAAEIGDHDVSAIIYTSGTTGTPKGVMLNQYGIVSDAISAAHNVFIRDTSMLVLPIHHTFGFTAGIIAVLYYGYPIAINSSLRTFLNDIQVFKPQNMFVVPMFVESMYKKIIKNAEQKKILGMLKALIKTSSAMRKIGIDKRKQLFKSVHEAFGGNLDTIISGGAPLDPNYCKYFDDFGIQILNGYGITECSPIVSVNCNDANRVGSVGKLLDINDVKIINPDEDGNGEICVRGENVMIGYFKNKKATAEAFEDTWFKTGDIGHLDEDNYLYISGRQKNLIILGNGKNIYPEELEELILRIPEALEAVVFCENEEIAAEIYTEDEAAVRSAIRALNRTLPVYKHIQKLSFRDSEFEKTTTKKIKRDLVAGKV